MTTMTTRLDAKASDPHRSTADLRRGNSIASVYRADARPDYRGWSIEELRAFATQMQYPNADRRSRSELLAFLGVGGE